MKVVLLVRSTRLVAGRVASDGGSDGCEHFWRGGAASLSTLRIHDSMALLGDPNIVHVALRGCTWMAMAMAMATVTATRCCGVAQGDLAALRRQREVSHMSSHFPAAPTHSRLSSLNFDDTPWGGENRVNGAGDERYQEATERVDRRHVDMAGWLGTPPFLEAGFQKRSATPFHQRQ